jgi:hypothetical protein
VIDNGVQVAFDFFALAIVFVFGAALMFGAVRYVKELLG